MHVQKLLNFPRPSHFKNIEKLEQYLVGHKQKHTSFKIIFTFFHLCVCLNHFHHASIFMDAQVLHRCGK